MLLPDVAPFDVCVAPLDVVLGAPPSLLLALSAGLLPLLPDALLLAAGALFAVWLLCLSLLVFVVDEVLVVD